MTHHIYAGASEDWDAEVESSSNPTPIDTYLPKETSVGEYEIESMDVSNSDEFIPSSMHFNSMNSHKDEQMCDTASQICFEQTELIDNIILRNSTLYLGNDRRNLYIALNVIRRLSHQILPTYTENLRSSSSHACKRRTVLICQSDSLLHQYHGYIHSHLPSRYSTAILSDQLSNEEFYAQMTNANILVMKPQTLLRILFSVIKISEINLIIFDKLRQFSTNPEYKEIMNIYLRTKLESENVQLPRILGLSVSFMFDRKCDISVKNLSKYISELARHYDTSMLTSNLYLEEWKDRVEPFHLVLPYLDTQLTGGPFQFSVKLQEYNSYINQMMIEFSDKKLNDVASNIHETIQKQTKKSILMDITPLTPPISLMSLRSIATQIHSVLIEIGVWGCFQVSILYFKLLQEYCLHCKKDIILFSAISNLSSLLKRYVIQLLTNHAPTLNDISNKVRVTLNRLITLCKDDYFSCIIFVEQNIVAYILSAYFNKLAYSFPDFERINSHFIISTDSNENQTLSHQNTIISMFRMHELNLLVSNGTQLDWIEIRSCSAVIMLNPISSFPDFIHSKEKIDNNGGIYICLSTELEKYSLVSDLRLYCDIEHFLFYDNSPEESFDEKHEGEKSYNFTTTTGVVLTEMNAIPILNCYCQYLNSIRDVDMYTCWKPYFKLKRRLVRSRHSSVEIYVYKCDIQMPKSCYVFSNIELPTQWSSSKFNAEQLAAYNVCFKLLNLGQLDENLAPIFVSIRYSERKIANPTYDIDVGFYPIKIASCLTTSLEDNPVGFLHPYFIKNDNQYELNTTFKSFAFLSASSLDLNHLPRIILNDWMKYIGAVCKEVEFIAPIQIAVSPTELEQFKLFNSVLFQQMVGDIDPLEYDYRNSKKRYLLIPVILKNISVQQACVYKEIDVEVLENLKSWPSIVQFYRKGETPPSYKDILVQKNYTLNCEKSNLFRIVGLNSNINIDSPFPELSKACSYKEYYKELHQISFTNPGQAALILRPFSNKIHNHLKKHDGKIENLKKNSDFGVDKRRPEILSFPQLLTPIPLLGSLSAQYRLISSICHRLESYMQALEFIQNLGYTIPLYTCLNALTLKRCGEEFDLERLEFFGDTCLKFIVVNHLFLKFPLESQGVLSNILAYRVKNSLLVKFANQKHLDLPNCITGREFSPSLNWLPPGFRVRDSENPEQSNGFTNSHQIANHILYSHQELYSKSIADAFESVLGAILTSTGLPNALLFLLSFGEVSVVRELLDSFCIKSPPEFSCDPNQFSENPFHFYLQGGGWFHNLYPDYEANYWDNEMCDEYEKNFHDIHSLFAKEKLKIEEQLSYQHKYLILQALTHDSYINQSLTPSYQRLNLLGDALSEYLVVSFLMTQAPESFYPKDLHIIKVCILTNLNLARICLNQRFHEEFLYSSYLLQTGIDIISSYIANEDENDYFDHEIHLVSNSRSGKVGVEDLITDAQKVLADVYKSLIASVYLISNFNLEKVWRSFGTALSHSAGMFLNMYIKSLNAESNMNNS